MARQGEGIAVREYYCRLDDQNRIVELGQRDVEIVEATPPPRSPGEWYDPENLLRLLTICEVGADRDRIIRQHDPARIVLTCCYALKLLKNRQHGITPALKAESPRAVVLVHVGLKGDLPDHRKEILSDLLRAPDPPAANGRLGPAREVLSKAEFRSGIAKLAEELLNGKEARIAAKNGSR